MRMLFELKSAKARNKVAQIERTNMFARESRRVGVFDIERMIDVHVRVSKRTYKIASEFAKANYTTFSNLLRIALSNYLSRKGAYAKYGID